MKYEERPATELQALRHLVYLELISLLPPASYAQAQRIMGNLFLYGSSECRMTNQSRVVSRLLLLRVSPAMAECQGVPNLSIGEIERTLHARFGERLKNVAGFYRHSITNRYKINLPEGCALYGYKNRLGFFSGILCQPLHRIDSYFLLSSAKLGGERAMRLEHLDREFFEQFNERAAVTV
jgi:hypothetical protein